LHLAHRSEDELPGFPLARAKSEAADDILTLQSVQKRRWSYVYLNRSVATALLYPGAPWLYHSFCDLTRHH
jgi:hypothetical protein